MMCVEAIEELVSPTDEEAMLEKDQTGYVSAIHRCESKHATKLCVFNLWKKLEMENCYDIGGTYTEKESDLWFYYTTSICHGNNYLMSLFVCCRKICVFSISVANTFNFKNQEPATQQNTLTTHTIRTSQPDECYYLKTFCYTQKDLKNIENKNVMIPIKIEFNPPFTVNNDIVRSIKLQHDLGRLLSKQEKTDFTIVSGSNKRYEVHKIILAAHSSELRNIIKNSKSNLMQIDLNDNDVDLLLEFIYTGTVKDMLKQDCFRMLEIADKFQLKQLFALSQYLICNQISVDNAINLAILAKKYNLEELQKKVFNFIKMNPVVMQTDGWNNLTDVELAKNLFQFVQKATN